MSSSAGSEFLIRTVIEVTDDKGQITYRDVEAPRTNASNGAAITTAGLVDLVATYVAQTPNTRQKLYLGIGSDAWDSGEVRAPIYSDTELRVPLSFNQDVPEVGKVGIIPEILVCQAFRVFSPL